MRLIDADELKDRLIRALRIDTVNENAPIGNDKRHTMKIEYKFSFYEIVKMLDEMPSAEQHYDCNHDCDALHEAYDRGYSKGFSEGREEEKKEVMLLTDHCFGKCDILESVLHMEGGQA